MALVSFKTQKRKRRKLDRFALLLIALIGPFDRTLFHAGPGVIADARREDSLQTRLLRVGECRLVIGEIDRLQLAFDDVVCKRRSGHHSRLAVNWVLQTSWSPPFDHVHN